MKSGWKTVTLKEISKNIQYGYTASATGELIGPKFLRITDIVPALISWNSVPYCEIAEKDLEKYLLHDGDIVIARTGATTGYAKYIKGNPNSVFASYLVRVQLKPDVDRLFIGKIVESDIYKKYIHQNIGGSAQPNANAKILTSFPISLPPLPAQHKIARILSTYDDLIENNTRHIQILEEMAQRIYREWFVHFRYPSHENDKLIESELGMIPNGWKIQKVGNLLIRVRRKKKIKKQDYEEQGVIPVIDQGRVFIGGYTNELEAQHVDPLPIIVFGDHTRILKYVDFPFACGADGVQLLLADTNYLPTTWFYYTLETFDLSDYAYARHFKFLKEKKVIVPKYELAYSFSNMVTPMQEEIRCLRNQNNILLQTRNFLLPKLISNKIDISELNIDMVDG